MLHRNRKDLRNMKS